jgi:hypothetical protein
LDARRVCGGPRFHVEFLAHSRSIKVSSSAALTAVRHMPASPLEGRTGRVAALHPGLLPTVHLPAAAATGQVEERGVLVNAKISRLASAGGRYLTRPA